MIEAIRAGRSMEINRGPTITPLMRLGCCERVWPLPRPYQMWRSFAWADRFILLLMGFFAGFKLGPTYLPIVSLIVRPPSMSLRKTNAFWESSRILGSIGRLWRTL